MMYVLGSLDKRARKKLLLVSTSILVSAVIILLGVFGLRAPLTWHRKYTARRIRHVFYNSTNGQERKRAFEDAGRYKVVELLPELRSLLEGPDVVESSLAAQALGKIAGPEAIHLLAEELRRGRLSVSWVAAASLARIESPDAMDILINEIQKDSEVADRAAWGLCVRGDRRAIPALVSALKSDKQLLRIYAAVALARLGRRECIDVLDEAAKYFERVASKYKGLTAEADSVKGDDFFRDRFEVQGNACVIMAKYCKQKKEEFREKSQAALPREDHE